MKKLKSFFKIIDFIGLVFALYMFIKIGFMVIVNNQQPTNWEIFITLLLVLNRKKE